MKTMYEKGVKFNNSKLGISLLFIGGLILTAMAIVWVTTNPHRNETLFMVCAVFTGISGLFSMTVSMLRARKLRDKNNVSKHA